MKLDFEKYGIDVTRCNRHATNAKTHCPQCHEQRKDKRDKSLSVNMQTGMFKCHYCGFSGCAAVQSESDRKSWMEQQPWFRPTPIRKQAKTYKLPTPKPHAPMGERALAWFRGRGISPETLAAMKVTEGMEWMPQKDGQANTVQFNYYRDGVLVNTKYRTGDKCFRMVGGAELLPYNIDAIRDTPECVITEGEMDALSFIECGRTDVVSVPNGANSTEWLDDYMERYFDDKQTIYIAVDTDTKGTQLRDELLRRFGPERCRIVDYGEGCKDANEHLMAHGGESLMECLASAPEINPDGVFRVSDFETDLDAIFEFGLQKGATVGHDNLDRLLSFETRRICVVTGIPQSGKSEFIDEMAERLNMRYGWRFAYFSPENAPLAYHASKLVEKFTGKRFSKQTLTMGEYRQVKEHLEENFFFIFPDSDYSIDTILDKARYLVRRRGIKALVIDPFNRLQNDMGNRNETQWISGLLDKLTVFAQRNDVLVILMAHPTKMPRSKDGVVEMPTLYDISGSAHFFNKCDFGIVVHRDRTNNTVLVKVEKVKFKHLGECGTATFKYNTANGRYSPYNGFGEPRWDNTNHLEEDRRQRERDIQEAAAFDYDSPEFWQESQEEVPF